MTIPVDASSAAKAAATAVIQDLISVSPAGTAADTGTAVSNWQTSVGAPLEDTIAAYNPSPRGATRDGAWTHAVDPEQTRANNAPMVLEQAMDALSDKQPGQPIYITNNLPYIGVLNNGSSTQEPGGYTDRAHIVAESAIEVFYGR